MEFQITKYQNHFPLQENQCSSISKSIMIGGMEMQNSQHCSSTIVIDLIAKVG